MRKVSAIVVLVVASALILGVAQTTRMEFQAQLSGFGKGKAKWKVDDRGGEMRAELQVEGENLAPNQPFTVTIDETQTWGVSTDAFGDFRLELRFRSADRPAIGAGSVVVVLDATGSKVLSGTMQRVR